jgi:hypothetical protein
VSITDDFRKALFHVLATGSITEDKFNTYYNIANSSYFGESAIEMPGDMFKTRYWGDHYDKMLAVKQKYDTDNFLWCRNCVGSDL